MPARRSPRLLRSKRVTNAMPQAAALAVAEKSGRYPLDDFLADISGIAATTEPIDLKRR